MSKLKSVLICIGLFISGISIWGYKMIITSDIPLTMYFRQLIGLFIIIMIYTILEYFYIKKLKSNLFLLNLLFLIILLTLWLGNLATALIYNYHIYDTIIDIVGFTSITISIIVAFTSKFKNKTVNN